MNNSSSIFDKNALDYDGWYEKYFYAYHSELEAVRRFIPEHGLGLEIGTGTGRFSTPFNISLGVEPSKSMAVIAEKRGITVHNTVAEDLPFCKEHFDFILMITTLCFVDDPVRALLEAYRILSSNGQLIIGILDKNTELGKIYESKKSSNKFYSLSKLYSTSEVLSLLRDAGFREIQTCQTIFSNPELMQTIDAVKDGYGKGLFVVINSYK
ncbi:MAG: class I SAM-dependent methyltransferase [Bacteroidota bacterium]|nr:class I SAM-dependent methyltransferase [Bacteroidota bacterium]